jgi:hypothetical protein
MHVDVPPSPQHRVKALRDEVVNLDPLRFFEAPHRPVQQVQTGVDHSVTLGAPGEGQDALLRYGGCGVLIGESRLESGKRNDRPELQNRPLSPARRPRWDFRFASYVTLSALCDDSKITLTSRHRVACMIRTCLP